MHLKTKVLAFSCAALMACGTARGIERPSGPGDLLFLATPNGLQALATDSGSIERELPGGKAAPGFEVLVSTVPDGSSTTVTRMAPDGQILSRTAVEGEVTARVVTDDLVALADSETSGETPYLPAPKRTTRIVIVADSGAQRGYELSGNFEPEAFKVDGSELFMIQYLPALASERYRVRRLRLANGAVRPIGRLKLNAPGQMQGTGRTQALSPWGDELYTLYTQQIDAGHDAGEHAADHVAAGHAFVHMLNLADGWAHCIDLPAVFASGSATASAIAVNPAGDRVFVADWTHGAASVLNPRRARVIETAEVSFGSSDASTFAVATQERLFVAGNSDVVVLDPKTFEVLDRWSFAAQITGMSLSNDRLYVSTDSEIVAVDPESGVSLATLDPHGATGLEGVVPLSK